MTGMDQMPLLIKKKKRKPKTNRKLIILFTLFFISIFIIIFFNSSLSKVSTVEIDGYYFLTRENVEELIAIHPGDPFFRLETGEAVEKLQSLPIVDKAEITRKFPGKVYVDITEFAHVGFIVDNGAVDVVLANGDAITLTGAVPPMDKPILSGWRNHEALKIQLSEALAGIPSAKLADISEIMPDPTPAYPDRIAFFSRSGYEVTTTVSKLAEKMNYFGEIVADLRMREIVGGRLILLEADTHEPAPNKTEEETG